MKFMPSVNDYTSINTPKRVINFDIDYYEILEVKANASLDEIKNAYRNLARKHHPDKNSNEETAKRNFQKLEEAYSILTDSEQRAEYDKKRKKDDIQYELREAFICKDLEKVKKLVLEVENLEKFLMQCVNIPEVGEVCLLYCFISNACEDSKWVECFRVVLGKKGTKIDFDVDIGPLGTALNYACEFYRRDKTFYGNRNVEELVKLLSSKANINEVSGQDKRTPIYIALQKSNYELANILFRCGARIDDKTRRQISDEICNTDKCKYTNQQLGCLLQYISPKQNTKILKCFLNKETLEDKDIEIVKLLLSKGADPYLENPNAVKLATDKGHTQLITLFSKHLNNRLVKASLDQDFKTVRNLIPKVENLEKFLMHRVNISPHGKVPLLYFLVLNIRDSFGLEIFETVLFGQSTKISDTIASEALSYACRSHNVCVVGLLFRYVNEIDVNKVSKDGRTPLISAAYNGNKELVEFLIGKGADVNKVIESKTAIYYALKHNDHNLASLFFQHGAKIDITPELEQAIIANSYSKENKYTKETIEVLLQYTSPEQNTEMLKRFSNNKILEDKDIEIVKLLLEKKADPCLGNPNAMEFATRQDNTQLTDLFSQSQLDSESQEAQATPLSSEQDSEESDNEFFDAEEDIVRIADKDKSEGNTRQATDEELGNKSKGLGGAKKNVLQSEQEKLSQQTKIDNLNSKIAQLTEELKETKATLEQENSSLVSQVGKLEEIKTELAEKDEELKSKIKKVTKLNSTIEELEKTNAGLEKEINNLTSLVDQLNEEKSALDSQLAKKKEELKGVQVQSEQEKTKLQDELKKKEEALNSKTREVTELTEEKNQLEKELKIVQQNLTKNIDELESTQAQLKKLQTDSDAKTKEFEDTKTQLEREQESAKQELDKTTEELRRKEADLENSKKDLDNVNEKVSNLEHETLNQQASINDLTKERDQLASEKNTLTEELKNKSKKLDDANQALDTKISEVTQLTEENTQLQSELESIRKTLGEKDSTVTQLTEENTKLKNELKLKKPENNDLKTKLQESESKSKGLEGRIENLQKQLESKNGLESKIQGLQKQLESKNKELNGKNERFLGASTQSRKQVTYASVSFVLSGALAVGASLTMFHLAMCITLAVAALTFLAVGCYCSYKANTALSNVKIDQIENGVDHVAA